MSSHLTASQVYRGSLEANTLAFVRLLREVGFLLGPQELNLALRTLELSRLNSKEDVRLGLRVVLAKTPLERQKFDLLFQRYWGGDLLDDSEMPSVKLPSPPQIQESLQLLDWEQGSESSEVVDTMGYSRSEVRSEQQTSVRTDELDALRRLVRRLVRKLATRASRRWVVSSRRAELLDVRRSLRHSVARGGELFDLRYKQKQLGKTKIVFVFDVSGSMMVYSQFLLQLALAFVRQWQLGKAEVFGFSTSLYHLTPALKRGGIREALTAAQEAMPGRSGGTKIGSCLRELFDNHTALLDRDTVLIINSDGWDTGDLEVLAGAMRALHERVNRLIWLNPLAGSPGYEPTASGMRTAMPYIDTFAASHNLQSLLNLVERL